MDVIFRCFLFQQSSLSALHRENRGEPIQGLWIALPYRTSLNAWIAMAILTIYDSLTIIQRTRLNQPVQLLHEPIRHPPLRSPATDLLAEVD